MDSGSQKSLLPPASTDMSAKFDGPQLRAAKGSYIVTFDTRLVTVCFHGHHFEWDFCNYLHYYSYYWGRFSVCKLSACWCCKPPVFTYQGARRRSQPWSIRVWRHSHSPWASPLHIGRVVAALQLLLLFEQCQSEWPLFHRHYRGLLCMPRGYHYFL